LSLSIQSMIISSIKQYKILVEIDAFEKIAVNRCWALACGKSTIVSIPIHTFSFAILYNCLTQSITVF